MLFAFAFVDASFSTNKDMTSQIGFVAVLMDNFSNCNIFYYSRLKAKRVKRSVLTAGTLAMVHSFELASAIRMTLNEMLRRIISFRVYIDSPSLYDFITKISRTSENRLLMDFYIMREAYKRRELAEAL